jgi:hypothetical protein
VKSKSISLVISSIFLSMFTVGCSIPGARERVRGLSVASPFNAVSEMKYSLKNNYDEYRDNSREREDELGLLRARRDSERDARDSQTVETLKSKLSLDMSQRMQLGALQVDTSKLGKLMAKRDKEYANDIKFHSEVNEELKRLHDADQKKQVSKYLAAKKRATETNCAFPKHLAQAPPKLSAFKPVPLPMKRAIRPTEIPFMVPVTVGFGLENPSISRARVLRERPEYVAGRKEEARKKCGKQQGKKPCGPDCKNCYPGAECVNPNYQVQPNQDAPPAEVGNGKSAAFERQKLRQIVWETTGENEPLMSPLSGE